MRVLTPAVSADAMHPIASTAAMHSIDCENDFMRSVLGYRQTLKAKPPSSSGFDGEGSEPEGGLGAADKSGAFHWLMRRADPGSTL